MRFPTSVTWPAQTILLPYPDSGSSGVLFRTCYACTIMRWMLMRGRACAHPLTIGDQLNQPEELLSPWHLFVQIILGSSVVRKATTFHSAPPASRILFSKVTVHDSWERVFRSRSTASFAQLLNLDDRVDQNRILSTSSNFPESFLSLMAQLTRCSRLQYRIIVIMTGQHPM